MYGGGINIKKDNVFDLVIGVDFLFLIELKQMVCEFLISDLSLDNCLFFLYMVEKYNVREFCDSF